MGWPSTSVFFFALLALFQEGRGLYCHECFSAWGGCGDDFKLMMFPWRSCPNSEFCVKVVEKYGSTTKITRACQEVLLKDTNHRLQMPLLQRHGYCLPARVNDPYNPQVTTNPKIQYCFCNDFNGCNTGKNLNIKFLPVVLVSAFSALFVSYL